MKARRLNVIFLLLSQKKGLYLKLLRLEFLGNRSSFEKLEKNLAPSVG
jgi:hypothetical protein